MYMSHSIPKVSKRLDINVVSLTQGKHLEFFWFQSSSENQTKEIPPDICDEGKCTNKYQGIAEQKEQQ